MAYKITDKLIQEIAECSAKGMSIRATERKIGVAHPTLTNWLNAGKTAENGEKKNYGKHGTMAESALSIRLQRQSFHAQRNSPLLRYTKRKNGTATVTPTQKQKRYKKPPMHTSH